jgi:hypothetical protein
MELQWRALGSESFLSGPNFSASPIARATNADIDVQFQPELS